MLLEAEQELIRRINAMREAGFEASKNNLLPELHVDVFQRMYGGCSRCPKDAYEALLRWADNKLKPVNQINMSTKYKFKEEYFKETVVFFHNGMKYRVTAFNLTDETAQLILAQPSKRHVLEPIEGGILEPQQQPINKPVKKLAADVKQPDGKQAVADPNAQPPKAKSLAEQLGQSTLTSNGQQKEEPPLRKKPGPKPKEKSPA